MNIGAIWDLIILQPVINSLIVVSHNLFSSFGLTIILFTIFIRGITYPLTVKQLRSSRKMQELQPKLQALQKKHARDKEKLSKEQMKLYRESGVNPAGCLVPMLIQMPIWIALYQAIIRVLAINPEDFLGLSQYLYSSEVVHTALPLGNSFLGLNLAESNFMLAILVGATMWLHQKMTMIPSADPRQQSQSRMMLWMMPMVFFFFSMQFPSGLALYWVMSNIISMVMQYFVGGWGGLSTLSFLRPAGQGYTQGDGRVKQLPPSDIPAEADITESDSAGGEGSDYGKSGSKRQDSRGGYTKSLRATRRQPKRGGGSRPK
ncbi:MAG: YidC/Oxa1 family membrane protein insertase [Chloroflexota bacterium]